MPGLYAHIPFCARRCPYCDFAVTVGRTGSFRAAYADALIRELTGLDPYDGEPFATVFFGGGTPTEMGADLLNRLLAAVRDSYGVAPDGEISLEANPENLDGAYLDALQGGGWNRLSLGAQSFDQATLATLGRQHTPAQVAEVVRGAQAAGFTNLSLDLIYAVPGQSLETWRATLQAAIALDVPHISAYALTIEPGTAFGRRRRAGELVETEPDEQAAYMETAAELLEAAGLARYEVSNYARPGFQSRHNQNYWRGGDYHGLGSGAHGHRRGHRWWNERDARVYMARIGESGSARAGEEWLDTEERLSEIVALGLRSQEGFDLETASFSLGIDVERRLESALRDAGARGWVRREGASIRPVPHMLAVADGLAVKLLQ